MRTTGIDLDPNSYLVKLLIGAVDSSYDTKGMSGFELSCTWRCRRLITTCLKPYRREVTAPQPLSRLTCSLPAFDLCYCSVVVLISERKPVKVSQQTTG